MKDNSYLQRQPQTAEGSRTPHMELISLQKDEENKSSAKFYTILFLLRGSCWFMADCYHPRILKEGSAVFIPMNGCYDFTAIEESTLILIQGNFFRNQLGAFSLEALYNFCPADKKEQAVLPVKPLLMEYLKQVETYLNHHFFNTEFFDIKIQELHILLTRFYTPEELALFFRSVLNADLSFATFVLNNWHWVNNVQELAELSHYCETGFRKKFRQVFGLTPYKWIQEKRSARLYYEILNNDKPFKVIAEEYGFKSLQHFNEYCNRYFNCPPGALRKKTHQ